MFNYYALFSYDFGCVQQHVAGKAVLDGTDKILCELCHGRPPKTHTVG
jgi:hypothetical protein